MIDPRTLQSFDVETAGKQDLYALQPCRARTDDAWLTSCAFSRYTLDGGKHTAAHRYPNLDLLREWLIWAAENKIHVVCWNSAFDVAWLIALGLREEVLPVKWLDGMLIQRHMENEPRYRPAGKLSMGLKACVERRWPEKAGYDEGVTFNPQTEEEWEKLLFYNGLDCEHTLDLVAEALTKLTKPQLRAMLIEAASIPMVAESIVEGIKVDTVAAQALAIELDRTVAKAFVTLKVSNPTVTPEVLASPKQLGNLLFDQWGLPVIKQTDKGAPSTDRETLTQLAVSDDRAKHVNDYREAKNNLTKFVTGSLKSAEYNGDGRTRPQARIFGTYSGRMTYSSKTGKGVAEVPTGSPLHQWKRDPAFRRLLAADDDYELLEFDFAGQEFRWMAVESNDPTMLHLCMPGEDAHSYMGGRCTEMDYHVLMRMVAEGHPDAKPKRQLGKVANLSLQYRTSARTLVRVAAVQHKVKLHELQAYSIWHTYRKTYTGVPKYWKRQIQRARVNGYVETLAGRRVTLGDPSTWVFKDYDNPDLTADGSWSHESTAINFPIQGIGADQKYLAMLVLKDYLPRVDGRFAWELHDGLFVMVHKAKADRAVHEIKTLLSNLPYEKAWGVRLPIQFPVDAKRSDKSWGDLVEIK